jgi:hypothetical protein
MGYYQQKRQDFNTNDVSVKKDNSLELTKSQNSVFIKCVSVARIIPESHYMKIMLPHSG